MRKIPIFGWAGLLLTGVLGCETSRPYCSRCMSARNNYAQSETAYRPKTTVTMRADEVPENPTQACPTMVQVVSPAGTSVVQTAGQTSTSTPMVTVTIPSIKIMVPVTATVGNQNSSAPELTTVTQLPPAIDNVVHADVKTSTPASSSKSPIPEADSRSLEKPGKLRHNSSSPVPDVNVQSAVHVQKEETVSAPPAKMELPLMPDPVPEPKPMSKSTDSHPDAARSPRLSLLPPDPPPDLPPHRTPATGSSRNSLMEMPPPPPPIPKSADSSGPALPSPEPETKD